MDIGELLSYKPPNTPKRPTAGEDDDEDEWESKRAKRVIKTPYHARQPARELQQSSPDSRKEPSTPVRATVSSPKNDVIEPQLSQKEKENILRYVESEAQHVEAIDETSLKRLVLLFEKRALKNQEMRVKFPDQPEKFLDSEVELHDVLQELHAIATNPDLYPLVVELGAVPSLLELLSHENTDITVAIVHLLQELTEIDLLHESQEAADTLIDALLEQQICALLVQNLERLDEAVKEESQGVYNTLTIFENLLEFRPDVCVEAGKQGLMQWILRRLKTKIPFNDNKLYASEMLSILLQSTPENRLLLGEMDGIDVLLQQLAYYKRHDPQSAEELEMMENLFNVLCSSLMINVNRDRFLRGEGLQLMNLMLREKKISRNGSLKVLDHAMSGPDGKENCTKFVDILGLRTIFPLFMKTPAKNRRKIFSAEEHEEHVISIIGSLLRNCKGQQRQRLLSKFTENDCEKVDRLMELHFKYLDKIEAVERSLKDDEDEEESYLKRLEGGLFTLQLVDYVLLEACAGCAPEVKQRVTRILGQRRASVKTIRHIMREYAGDLGDAGDTDWKEAEQRHILQLIDKF
ncbi:beta-catenin-like protein 1 [Prorops nasuta]|uniref:beta-catenin-like protein 1 n=1 Tax=Prorops nasuta TaxID=863751 RepID=UPI0034CFD533